MSKNKNLNTILQKLQDELTHLRNIVSSSAEIQDDLTTLKENTNIEELLKLTMDSIPGIYWWKDLDGIYRGCNQTLIEYMGFESKDEVIGKTDYELPWKKYAAELIKIDKQVLVTESAISSERMLITNDNKHKVFYSIKMPLKDRFNGIIGVIGSAIDITEKSESMYSMRQRFDSIVDILAGNHWWKDLDGRYLGCNSVVAKTLGVTMKEIIGKTDYELPWSEQADKLVANDNKVLERGISVKSEEEAATKDGKILTFLVNKVPLKNEKGEIIGTIGNSIDITHTKELEKELLHAKEEAEQSSKSKSDFIQNMEHDIRTPCSGIYQLSQVLERKEKDKEKKEVLKYITQASSQLLNVLNSIIDFSRMESGFAHILAKKFNLRELIKNIVELETPSAHMKDLKLITVYPDNMQSEFIGDEFRIHRMLLNLVSNSIKFTEKGYVKIVAELIKQKDDKNTIVRLIVEDTGIGISDRAQAILFEKFTKEHPSNTGLYQGSGLGLRIVKQFIHELDGEIEVESQTGEGSTFILNIPLKISISSKE